MLIRTVQGQDSPTSTITVFSSSRVFPWKSASQRLRQESFKVGESQPRQFNQKLFNGFMIKISFTISLNLKFQRIVFGKSTVCRVFVVTSTQNYQIIQLFNIIEIINNFKIFKQQQIGKLSSRGGLVVELWTENSLPSATVGSNLRIQTIIRRTDIKKMNRKIQ